MNPNSNLKHLNPNEVNKITIFFGHVASNVGDLAINVGEHALLRQVFPQATIQFVFFNAEKSPHLDHAITSLGEDGNLQTSFFRTHSRKALQFVHEPEQLLIECGSEDADLIFLASGEHLFAYEENPNHQSMFWRLLPILAAKALKKHCYLFPSTLGPFENKESIELCKASLACLDSFALRDAKSKFQIADLQPEDASLNEQLDPAFFISNMHEGTARTSEKKRIALVLRSSQWGIRLGKKRAEEIMSQEADVSEKIAQELTQHLLQDSDCELVLLVQTDADKKLAQIMLQSVDEELQKNRIELTQPETLEEYMGVIHHVDAVIASRFHAIILALVAGKTVMGIYHDEHGHKMPGLFELLGMEKQCWCVKTDQVTTTTQEIVRSVLQWPSSPLEGIDNLRQRNLEWLKTLPLRDENIADVKLLATSLGKIANRFAIDLVYDSGALPERKKKAQFAKLADTNAKALKAKELELQDANGFLQQVEQDLLQTKEESQRYQNEIGELTKTLDAQKQKSAQLNNRCKTLIKEQNQLKQEQSSLKSSLAMRLGKTLERSITRPWLWLFLPFLLLRQWWRFKQYSATQS